MFPKILKSTFHRRMLLELLLQVNVTFPLSGTLYPPGIGRASAESVTEEDTLTDKDILVDKALNDITVLSMDLMCISL